MGKKAFKILKFSTNITTSNFNAKIPQGIHRSENIIYTIQYSWFKKICHTVQIVYTDITTVGFNEMSISDQFIVLTNNMRTSTSLISVIKSFHWI